MCKRVRKKYAQTYTELVNTAFNTA